METLNSERWYLPEGRIRRSTYFVRLLAGGGVMLTTVLALAFALTETPAREVVGPFVVLAMLAFYAFRVVQDVKRLHDLGYSGGWAVLVFVPAVNALYSLYLLFGDGQPYTNQFGPDPKGRGAEQDIAEIANTFR